MFWGDEIDEIEEVDAVSGHRIESFDEYKIYPANLFMTTKESTLRAIHQIEDDLTKRVAYFRKSGNLMKPNDYMKGLRMTWKCSGNWGTVPALRTTQDILMEEKREAALIACLTFSGRFSDCH